MKTPDQICLIDTGDGIDWCDSVPSNDIPDESVVWYTRTDPLADKLIEAAILHKRSHMSDCQCVLCKAVSAWHIEDQKVTP